MTKSIRKPNMTNRRFRKRGEKREGRTLSKKFNKVVSYKVNIEKQSLSLSLSLSHTHTHTHTHTLKH